MRFFADLHIHIGRTSRGEAVKVTASDDLTFSKILKESADRKGLDAVAIVDCASPGVLADMKALIEGGEMAPMDGGGLLYRDRLVVYPAAEVGVDVNGREAHFLSYLPSLEAAAAFSDRIAPYVTNLTLSSQKARMTASQLLEATCESGGFLVPAHVFTPHKGFYGHSASRLDEGFDSDERGRLVAIELGLSADTEMASRLSDLDSLAFLSNSDAHSLAKIAREYNEVEAPDASFDSLLNALKGNGGKIAANYGLDPRLGKYHRTHCDRCRRQIQLTADRVCPDCGSNRITVGVADRLEEVADRESASCEGRAPYVHQVPLEFVPGVGPRTLQRLLDAFQTEMNVLHRVTPDELESVVGAPIARRIVMARSGSLSVAPGGGGVYGKVTS